MLHRVSRVVVLAVAVLFISPAASSAGTVLEFLEAQFNRGGVDGLDGAASVVVSLDGAHVYVAGSRDGSVAVFMRNAARGVLTFVEAEFDGVGGVDGLDGATSVAVSPDGGHVYAAGSTDGSVAVFKRNVDTGELTFVAAQFDGVGGVDGLFGACSVAVSPDGERVYIASFDEDAVAVFARDTVTGGLTFVEAEFYGVGGVRGLRGATSVAVSSDGGHVYVVGYYSGAVAVFVRDTATGGLTFVEAEVDGVAGVEGLRHATSVAVSPDGGHVFVVGYYGSSMAVFERDVGTGELTFVEAEFDGVDGVDGLRWPTSVAVSPDSANVYVAAELDDAVAVFWKGFPSGLAAGNEAYYAQDWADAEQLFSQAIAVGGQTTAVAHNNRGLARCKQLDFAGARADFDAAKGLDSTYVAPYLNQGKCLAMQRDLGGARIEFEAGLAIDPEHVKLLYNLGWVEAEQSRYDEAIARYGDALTADPTYVRALAASGVALAMKGDHNSAVDAFYETINTAPTGDLFAAMSAYNLQLMRGPGVSSGTANAAEEYEDALFNMRVGLFAEAEQILIAAQTMAPNVPEIPWMLAWCDLRRLQTGAAADAHADALALMPALDIDSSEESQLFIDGIFRGNTPQTVEVFPSRFDVAFRRAEGPLERTVVAYADGTPGGESPIATTLEDVSSLSLFAAVTDADRDWLGDDWEVLSFGDLSQSPWSDPDGDGVSNLREYWANTDPMRREKSSRRPSGRRRLRQ